MKKAFYANILVIDDSIVSCDYFKRILESEQHSVYVTHNAKGFMELIEKHNIDIILLDVIMPDVDGFEVLRQLQEAETTRDIPVIMITGLSAPEAVKKALDMGALDFIRKPCEPIELIARVNSAIRLKAKQDLFKDDALRDVLTGQFNRRYFNKTIDILLKNKPEQPNGLSLIIMDCDYFKSINDEFGHAAGDEVLTAVGNAVSRSVNITDTVCRFGGEEFCVLLPNTTMVQAYMAAERIRDNVRRISFVFAGKKLSITISCGVSHSSIDDRKTDKALLSEADSALYRAKQSGRNQTQIYMEKEYADNYGSDK